MNSNQTTSSQSMAAMNAFYPMIVVTGLIQLLVPSTIHIIMVHYNLKPGEAGILPFIFFSGIMICAFVITHLIKKLTIKSIMIFTTIIVSVSLLAASQSQIFYVFAFLCLFIGFGTGVLLMVPGIYATNIYGKKSAQLQSLIFSFLALGFVIGPVFPGIISYLEISWRWSFAFPGLLILPALLPILLVKHEPVDEAEKLSVHIVKEIISFDRKFFIGIVITIIIAAGSTVALLTWLITFFEVERGTSLGTAHIVLAFIGVANVIGRLFWRKVSAKITVFRTLFIIVPISAILVFLAPLSEVTTINIVLFFTVFLFISAINPLLLSVASIYPRLYSSSAYTIFFMSMTMGGIIIPFCIGQIFQYAGPEIGISSISLMFVIATGMLFFIKTEIPIIKQIYHNPFP